MTFGTPLFLIAILAGAIPVLLHMIHRQQAKVAPFSTLRFLQISIQRTRRRKYLHDVLLLLLRVAAFVFIALGLAKPTLTHLHHLVGASTDTAAVLIVDNSASMASKRGGKDRSTPLDAFSASLTTMTPSPFCLHAAHSASHSDVCSNNELSLTS